MESPVSTCSGAVPCHPRTAGPSPGAGRGKGLSGDTSAGSHSLSEELLRLPLP